MIFSDLFRLFKYHPGCSFQPSGIHSFAISIVWSPYPSINSIRLFQVYVVFIADDGLFFVQIHEIVNRNKPIIVLIGGFHYIVLVMVIWKHILLTEFARFVVQMEATVVLVQVFVVNAFLLFWRSVQIHTIDPSAIPINAVGRAISCHPHITQVTRNLLVLFFPAHVVVTL